MRVRRNAIAASAVWRRRRAGKLLLGATWSVSRASADGLGSGSDSSPAFSSCQTYWLRPVQAASAPGASDRLLRQAPGLAPGGLLPLATTSRLPSLLTLTAFGSQPGGLSPPAPRTPRRPSSPSRPPLARGPSPEA